MKPLIVVTGPDKRFPVAWWATRLALWWVGLRGHYVTPSNPDLPQEARGVIIGGGDDIGPEHYGVSGDAGADCDPARDALEMAVLRDAWHSKVPILGICRGAQLINVVRGGTLYRDLRPRRRYTPNRNSILPIKWVRLDSASRLAGLLGRDAFRVNSLHNQAVDRAGDQLRKVAWDADDFVQAVEDAGTQFVVGVQWHPEYMPYAREQRRLFQVFADAVSRSPFTLMPVTLAVSGERNV